MTYLGLGRFGLRILNPKNQNSIFVTTFRRWLTKKLTLQRSPFFQLMHDLPNMLQPTLCSVSLGRVGGGGGLGGGMKSGVEKIWSRYDRARRARPKVVLVSRLRVYSLRLKVQELGSELQGLGMTSSNRTLSPCIQTLKPTPTPLSSPC